MQANSLNHGVFFIILNVLTQADNVPQLNFNGHWLFVICVI